MRDCRGKGDCCCTCNNQSVSSNRGGGYFLVVPEISMAFETVTFPEVAPPMVLKSVAATAEPAESLIVSDAA